MLASPRYPDASPPHTLASDMSYFRDLVLLNEIGLTDEQKLRFDNVLESAKTPETIDELSLTMLEALAVIDNAHTTVLAPRMYRLPVRFHWTTDALIIVKTRPEYSDLLGQRVLSLGGRTPEQMLDQVHVLVGGGTANWKRYRSEFLYSAPSALSLMGAQVENRSVQLSLVSPNGEHEVIAIPADSEAMPGDPFWDFLDAFPSNKSFQTEGWKTLLSSDQPLPLYLQQAERILFAKNLPNDNAIYIRLNGSFNDDRETLTEFRERVLSTIDEAAPCNIIVDFRYNRGGDYTKVLPLVRDISQSVPPEGRLYLITGPNTFSAGLVAGSQFKRYIPDQLTVVGSEVGDVLRFKAEGFAPKLPASDVQVYLTTAWGDVGEGCGWLDDCFLPNKLLVRGIGSFEVDIQMENTWSAFVNGEDLVLRAIQSDIKGQAGQQ